MQWIVRLPFFVVLMGLGAIAMLVPSVHAAVLDDFQTMRVFFYAFVLFALLTVTIGIATAGYEPYSVARSQLVGLLRRLPFCRLCLRCRFMHRSATLPS